MVEQPGETLEKFDPQLIESLTEPLSAEDFSKDKIEQNFINASWVGALLRLGLEIRDTGEFSIELKNKKTFPINEVAASETVSIRGAMFDKTSEYAARFISQNVPIPSPKAVVIHSPTPFTVYTSDSINPKEAILAFDMLGDFRFQAVLDKGKLISIHLQRTRNVDRNMYLTKQFHVRYRSGYPKSFEVSQFLGEENAVLELSRRAYHNISRAKRLHALEAPAVIIDNENNMVRNSIADLADEIKAEIEGEELSDIVRKIKDEHPEDILRDLLNRSNLASQADTLINSIKEDIHVAKEHGFSARISPLERTGKMVSVQNFGNTTHLLKKWRESVKIYGDQQVEQWLHWLSELDNELQTDFENFAEIVRAEIEFSGLEDLDL